MSLSQVLELISVPLCQAQEFPQQVRLKDCLLLKLHRCRAQRLLLQRLVCLAGPVQARAVSPSVVLANAAVRDLRQVFSEFVVALEIRGRQHSGVQGGNPLQGQGCGLGGTGVPVMGQGQGQGNGGATGLALSTSDSARACALT